MSAETNKLREALSDQLSDLDDSLGATVDDVQMLSSLQQAVGRLLADDIGIEKDIRTVLTERFDKGDLRRETFQLVSSMLDRFVTEHVATAPTSPGVAATPPEPSIEDTAANAPPDDIFSSTTVIPSDAFSPVSAEDRVQVGSVLRDRFLLQQRVSGGSMGVVYKALDRRLAEAGSDEPWVAIKVLSPQLAQSGPALRALQQEAAKGRCLMHPNIVRFVDLDRDDDLYFIVMEWLEGRTLADILDSADGKGIDQRQSIEIVRQIGRALEYAHRCGIVHADVKPGNVMIAPDGQAKLFDFGVARVRQTQDSGPEDLTVPGVVGAMTPAYSSMQVLTGEEPVPSDDVFSLGCLMYRLVAGYRVFGPRNAAEAAEEGMTPQQVQSLTEPQWLALKKAISYSRIARFETMGEFLAALDGPVIAEQPMSIHAEERHIEHHAGSSIRWLFGFVGLIGVLGFAIYQFGLSEPLRAWLDQVRSAPAGDSVEDLAPAEAVVDVLPGSIDPESLDQASLDAGPLDPVPVDDALPSDSLPVAIDSLDEVSASVDEDSSAGMSEAMPALQETSAAALVDFSTLPAADHEIPIGVIGGAPAITVTLREDGQAVSIDLVRNNADSPSSLRVEEVRYSGNRSPWAAGQYTISGDGLVEFPAGQARARITLDMASDPLREADQQSTLRIRDAESTTTELATVDVVLEDDDQRAFEAGLPANTVAFAVSQVSVRERDPAVQIDILRFNPDDRPYSIGIGVRDITASDGEDYFSPSTTSVSFDPRQRSARLLIPLVQDSASEGDEAFTVELATLREQNNPDVYQRIVVMIRDDD